MAFRILHRQTDTAILAGGPIPIEGFTDQSSSHQNYATSATHVASGAAGDLIVAVCMAEEEDLVLTGSAGWTQIGTMIGAGVTWGLWYKTLTVADTADRTISVSRPAPRALSIYSWNFGAASGIGNVVMGSEVVINTGQTADAPVINLSANSKLLTIFGTPQSGSLSAPVNVPTAEPGSFPATEGLWVQDKIAGTTYRAHNIVTSPPAGPSPVTSYQAASYCTPVSCSVEVLS